MLDMIDNKKIEKIAKQHAEGTFIQGAWQDCYKVGFIDCAKWMQEEFLKDLIYSVSEKPKSNSKILIKIKAYRLVLSPEGKREDICGYFYEAIVYNNEDKWQLTELEKEYCCNLKVIQWLYIDDLFQKEGGEQ